MLTTTPANGTRVERIDGGQGYQGMKGTVVDIKDGRVQVKWDDEIRRCCYRPETDTWTRKGKRTWVKLASLRTI